jgi:hypothetical protein
MGEACTYRVRAMHNITPGSQRYAGTPSRLQCYSIAVSKRDQANGSRETSRGAARANARSMRSRRRRL